MCWVTTDLFDQKGNEDYIITTYRYPLYRQIVYSATWWTENSKWSGMKSCLYDKQLKIRYRVYFYNPSSLHI